MDQAFAFWMIFFFFSPHEYQYQNLTTVMNLPLLFKSYINAFRRNFKGDLKYDPNPAPNTQLITAKL